MECDTPIDDYCAAWAAPYLRTPELTPPSSSTTDQFYIRFVLEFLRPSPLAMDYDDEDFDENNFDSTTKTEHFWAPCNRQEPDHLPHEVISGMLSDMGVPSKRQPFLLQKISDCANEIANAAHNKGEKILPMIVSASVLVDDYIVDEQQEDAESQPI